jgi:hypothetical protein
VVLPGSAWVQIKPSASNINHRLEVLGVMEATGHAPGLPNSVLSLLVNLQTVHSSAVTDV